MVTLPQTPASRSTLDVQALMDAVTAAVIVVDAHGGVQMLNCAASRLFGYGASEALPSKLEQLLPDVPAPSRECEVSGFASRELNARRMDGCEFPVRVSIARVANSEPAWFAYTVHALDDVDQLQARMMQMSRLATLGEMAAGMTHELNQPLTAIANYAQAGRWLLESKPPDLSEVNDSLGEISSQALRAGAIILRLRGLIQKGEIRREPVRLDEAIHELQGLILMECRLQSAKLKFAVEPGLPHVMVDRIQIQQVVLLLLRNAIEALDGQPRDQREISIHSAVRPEGVEIAISDSGPSASRERRGPKLAMARSIVEALQGTLGYRPQTPNGACFFFYFPIAQGGEL
jgi:two-component system sensor kinase FixL